MKIGQYKMNVLVDKKPLVEVYDESANAIWVTVSRGQVFQLLIVNMSDSRICAVTTVDGLSIMNGKPGSYRSNGYILDSMEHIVIPGWRLDREHVASFEFGTTSQSYATKSGQSVDNIGVIACACFKEAIPEPPPKKEPDLITEDQDDKNNKFTFSAVGSGRQCKYSLRRDLSTKPESKDRKAPHTDDVAVKFGAKRNHSVTTMSFDRASEKPDAVLMIRYDTSEGIKRRNVGCTPPPGWEG